MFQVCDGIGDCSDGSDELCHDLCAPASYNGRSIMKVCVVSNLLKSLVGGMETKNENVGRGVPDKIKIRKRPCTTILQYKGVSHRKD